MNQVMIDKVVEIVRAHGGQPNEGSNPVNQYFPSPWPGEYFVTDENNGLIEWRSELGSFSPINGGLNVYTANYWSEFVEAFNLVCVSDQDASGPLTYPGHRRKYWKIGGGCDELSHQGEPACREEHTVIKNVDLLRRLAHPR